MRKIIVWGLLLSGLIYLGVNWYLNRAGNNTETTVQTGAIDIVYPDDNIDTPEVNNDKGAPFLSQNTKSQLLFDAPSSASYLLSSANELLQDKSLAIGSKANKKTLILGLDHPNGVRVLALNGDKGQNLINDVPDGPFFNDYGDLVAGNSIQVTVLDLNGDGSKNVVIAIGKYNGRIDASIFGLDSNSSDSYNYMGSIVSSSTIKFTDGKIITCNEDDTKAYKLQDSRLIEVH